MRIALEELSCRDNAPAHHEVLEALSRDGFCFVQSDNSSSVIESLLSELSRFFRTASDREKAASGAYLRGLLRGYFPPLDPESLKLERRKERYVFGGEDNLFPENYPRLKQAYEELY